MRYALALLHLVAVISLPLTAQAQWITDGVALSTAPFTQSNPKIVSDGAGGAIVTFSDDRGTSNIDIYAQRVSNLGVALWTTD